MNVFVHIGPAKTGTTTIQAFLNQNREPLKAQGVFTPGWGGGSCKQIYLAIFDDRQKTGRAIPRWALARGIKDAQSLEAARPPAIRQITQWLKTSPCPNLFLSHEGLTAAHPEEISRFKALLAPHCDRVIVLAGLRRQDLQLNSHNGMHIRFKGRTTEHIERGRMGSNYLEILNKWSKPFGAKNVRPFIFPDSDPEGGDLIEAFFAATGLDLDLTDTVTPPVLNKSLDVRALDMLRGLNDQLPPVQDKSVPPGRRQVEAALKEAFPEPIGYVMPRERALKIIAANADANAEVARRWFGRETLFHDSMAKYDRPRPEVTDEDWTRVIAILGQKLAAFEARTGVTIKDLEEETAREASLA